MSKPETITIYTDGASRGNPGASAYAYVIKRDGTADIEEKGRLPDTTNNIAEYTALVRALEHAKGLGALHVEVLTDSELMARQIQGTYRVKNEGLRPLYEKAVDLIDDFDVFEIRHVPRAQNAQADRLCNEILNDKPKAAPAAKRGPSKAAPALSAQVREEALACLQSVAAVWARGNPADPKPEQVWDQLWSILEEAGVIKTSKG